MRQGFSLFFYFLERIMINYQFDEPFGRREIFTTEPEVTEKNIFQILSNVIGEHLANQAVIEFLLRYEAGNQPLTREKTVRTDIDIEAIDNVAAQIAEFKCAYHFGNTITLVQRGEKDSGDIGEDEPSGITLLNECYEAENLKAKTQKLARFVEICGIGHTFIDINTEYEEGDSYFDYEVLDSRYTFLVRSSYYVDHRPILGVTYRTDEDGCYFTCWTKDRRYEVKNLSQIINGLPMDKFALGNRSGEVNPLGMIPIVEWVRSYDRMGCFERQISALDNLNIMISDFSNCVDTLVQAYWQTVDISFPLDENGNETSPRSGDWIRTYTTRDGKSPKIVPLTIPYDFRGMLENITIQRELILQKCNVPQRNENSGGSTGVAMSDATGWTSAELSAQMQENIMESCKMQEVRLALAAIRKSPYVPSDSPLLKLKYSDMKPNIKRQKTYEMSIKLQSYAVGVSHGIAPDHMIKAINFFDDPQQVIADSEPYMQRYLDSIYEPQVTESGLGDRSGLDYNNNIENSPVLDGPSKVEPMKEDNPEADRTDKQFR